MEPRVMARGDLGKDLFGDAMQAGVHVRKS